MDLEYEILINKYGQGLVNKEPLLQFFKSLEEISQKAILNDMLFLIQQSKAKDDDIDLAILNSGLKSTYTPCVLLKKGVLNYNLERIINLPKQEMTKVFLLLLSLFREAYQRRFLMEKNNPEKWWYWDLSDESNISRIRRNGGNG